MKDSSQSGSGRLIKAPENFLTSEGVRRVFAEGKRGRRDFIRGAFAAAAAGVRGGKSSEDAQIAKAGIAALGL